MNAGGWFSTRGLAAFAGGASLGLLAGRVLPPLVTQATATLGRRGDDPFATLIDDHRRFSRLLSEMVEARGQRAVQRTQLLLRLKRGLAAHAMAEEDVVYPLLHDEAEAQAAADRLYAEHGSMKTHLYALERSIGDEAAWLARAAALKALVEAHARDEEEVEFPRLRRRLDADAARRTARHVRREKAMVL